MEKELKEPFYFLCKIIILYLYINSFHVKNAAVQTF